MSDHTLVSWREDTLPRLEVELVGARPQVVLGKNGRPKDTGETLPPEVRFGIFPRGRIATGSPVRLRRLAILLNQAADELHSALAGHAGEPGDLFDEGCCFECGADLDNQDHDPDCPEQYLEPLVVDVPTGSYL